MSLYNCTSCGAVENTALDPFWMNKAPARKQLCHQCGTGKHHDRFPRTFGRVIHDGKGGRVQDEASDPNGSGGSGERKTSDDQERMQDGGNTVQNACPCVHCTPAGCRCCGTGRRRGR